jgi:hypothetical protein
MQNQLRFRAALLLTFGLGLSGLSRPAESQVTAVAGAGSRSCTQMQTDISDLPNTRRAYVSWMQGYLSGRNVAREAAGRALIDLADYEAQWDWIVSWCGERPDGTFAEAVGALFDARAD